MADIKQTGEINLTQATDHIKMITRELTTVGIKPEIEKTNGGHVRIKWGSNGHRQSVLTSATPSDYRATLNARARVRRILRQTGMYDKPETPSLVKALKIQEPEQPLAERVAQLEADFGALLDLVIDARMKEAGQPGGGEFLAGWQAHAAAVTEALERLVNPPPARQAIKRHKGSWVAEHLDRMTWRTAKEIQRLSSRPMGSVYNALHMAKRKQLAESNDRHEWRRIGK